MKYFAVFVIFTCLVFPGFAQSANSQRYKTLGDSITRTVSNSNDKLADYNDQVADDGNTKSYTNYKRRYDSLSRALHESESRLDFLIRTNDRTSKIKAEKDTYERLIKEMEDLKSDYDNWLKNVQ